MRSGKEPGSQHEGAVDAPHLGRTGPQGGREQRHHRDAQVRAEKCGEADQADEEKRSEGLLVFRHGSQILFKINIYDLY